MLTDGRSEGGVGHGQQAPVEEPAPRHHQEEPDRRYRSVRHLGRHHASAQRLEEEGLRRVLQVTVFYHRLLFHLLPLSFHLPGTTMPTRASRR